MNDLTKKKSAPEKKSATPFPSAGAPTIESFLEPIKIPESENTGPLEPVVMPASSPNKASSERPISRKDRQRRDEAAARAAERPFRELDAQAREVYARNVSIAKELLNQAGQPYIEKYERIVRMAELNSQTLFENSLFLGYTNYATADNYLYAHSANVAIISQAIGMVMGLEKSLVNFLGFCAMAHDIGMSDYAEMVSSAERLSDEDYSSVMFHSEVGAAKIGRLLDMDYRLKERAQKVILQVHERGDASGYPNSLMNEEIDILAQIVGIADVYEAVSHPRPWRPAIHPHTAIKRLIDREEKGFDSKVIKAIIEVLSIYPPGSLVALSTGEIASVIKINKGSLTRPVVAVLLDGDFEPVSTRLIDLMEHPLKGIERIVEESELVARNPNFAARQELARWWVEW